MSPRTVQCLTSEVVVRLPSRRGLSRVSLPPGSRCSTACGVLQPWKGAQAVGLPGPGWVSTQPQRRMSFLGKFSFKWPFWDKSCLFHCLRSSVFIISTKRTYPLISNQFPGVLGCWGLFVLLGQWSRSQYCLSDSVVTPKNRPAYQQNTPLFSWCCLFAPENKALCKPSTIWEILGTVMSPSVVGNWKAEGTYANTFFWNLSALPI